MGQALLRRYPLIRVDREQPRDEVLRRVGDLSPTAVHQLNAIDGISNCVGVTYRIFSLGYTLKYVLLRTAEWQPTAEENVQDDTYRPPASKPVVKEDTSFRKESRTTYMSALVPYGRPLTTSGAMNGGIPMRPKRDRLSLNAYVRSFTYLAGIWHSRKIICKRCQSLSV